MIRTSNTRRQYGTTLVVWGLVIWIILTVLFSRRPILTYTGDGGTYTEITAIYEHTINWQLALPTLAVVIAAGFLLRLSSYRHPHWEAGAR
jgi:hypothetical protein